MDHLHYTGNTKKTCGSKGTECSAMNCTKYTKTNKEVAFHSFPKDDARCAEWIRNLRREDLLGKTPDQMKWRRVCSDHFATSQFKNPNDRKSGLLPNSIPWLIDCPDPPKSGDVRRKQPHDRGRSAPVEGRDSSSMNEVKKELGNGCDGSMKIEEIYIKEELIEPEQEPSNTEDRRGEKRRAHSRSRSPDSKKQRPEVEEARVEDKPEYDRSKVLLDCYAGDFELEPDHDEQYEEEEEDPDAPDPDSARENEPSLELEPGQVKEELGNEYDSFMYSEEIDIKEELIEPKQEPSHTEDIQGEKRRAHSRSCSPDSKKQRPEVEEVRVEDEPEYDKSAVLLDWYNRDLSLIIDKETFLSAKPMTSDGSAYVWHGVRARYGFLHGHLFYEVKVEDHLAVPHLEGEQHPYGLRCGWSIGDAEMTLGEEPFSYGYGGTAEASTNLKFKDYGQPLKKGDVIGCFLDMDSRPITMSFSVNGRNFGKCYEVFHRSLRGKALFPHILTKNCAFKVNFGSEYPWFQPMARYTFVGQIPLEERVLGSQEPQTRQDSEEEIKQKKIPQGSRRQTSYAYNLQLPDGSTHRVCKPMFASTFGVPERTLMRWIRSASSPHDSLSVAKTLAKPGPKSGKYGHVTDAENEFLRAWLKCLPTVDSHYCRSTPTYKEKKFLYPGTTIANLHREYKMEAQKGGARAVEISYFTDKFNEENLSVPRKDWCDICESFKFGNISKDEYDRHIKVKDEARREKTLDKDSASASKSVWTMDLQAVLLCPKTMASTMNYKTKLQVHNFTLYDLKSKKGYCYIWNETEGDLKSEIFSHLQYHHFETIISESPNLQELVIWSDGCSYQNRNVKVANAYSALARKHGISIVQKYLVAGHTQMECDSMHSTIERKLVNDVFTERDYAVLIQCARIKPSPYIVRQMKHQDFMKMENLFFTSIRPGKKSGDPVVHDLQGLMYQSDGTVKFRVSFNIHSTWETLPHRIQNVEVKWIPLFSSRLPITMRKFSDLQSMKTVMPADCYDFFDTLPHDNE
ncbi:uncharacterized protein [Macrobrachium rosenbergii]|uniref:uncharacterized protein isoform X5 n=1 Tax=Macrobrachium rosenbergii TaxID=79674 RepID=UPI0034D7365F